MTTKSVGPYLKRLRRYKPVYPAVSMRLGDNGFQHTRPAIRVEVFSWPGEGVEWGVGVGVVRRHCGIILLI